MSRIRHRFALGALLFLFAAAPAPAAPPEVPLSIVYQGVLLDNAGEPRTGNVDLKVRVFDASSAGTLLYVQSYTAVPLDAGTFSIALGPTGAAADGAATPLTTALADVFAGDLPATAPERWLELQVGTSNALARTRLQSAPFALRAGSAESADVAIESIDTTSVGGVPSDVVSQLWENGNLDGTGPNNSDPIEGLLDSDGDGVANFLEADNDGDGVADGAEITQGASPNLPTPRATAVQPAEGLAFVTTPLTVAGQGFQPGLSADLGGVLLSPQSVTSTSFLADFPAGPPSGPLTLTLTNSNGETSSLPAAFVRRNGISGGGAVDVLGAEQVLLATSRDGYKVSSDSDFYTDLTFTLAGVASDQDTPAIRWDASGRVMGLFCLGGATCDIRLLTDLDGDFDLSDETPVALEAAAVDSMTRPSLALDASGRVAAAYVKDPTSSSTPVPVVAYDRDGDGTFTGPNERVELAAFFPSGTLKGTVLVDPLGRLAYLYPNGSIVITAYDLNGDGDFADTGEVWSFGPGGTGPVCLGAVFDPSGHLAVVVGNTLGVLKLGRDADGDGQWAEAGELLTLDNATHCGIGTGPGVPIAVSRAAGGTTIEVLRDLNDDGDFADADESRLLQTSSSPTSQTVRVGATGMTFIGTSSELVITGP